MNKIRMITGKPKSGKTYFTSHLPTSLTLDCYNDNSIGGYKIIINTEESILGNMNVCVSQLVSDNILKDKFINITIDGFDVFYFSLYREYNDIIARRYWEQSVSDDVFQAVELKVFEWFSTLLSFGYDINLIVGKTTGSIENSDVFRSITRVVNCFDNRYNNVDNIHCFYNEEGEHMISINKSVMKFDEAI